MTAKPTTPTEPDPTSTHTPKPETMRQADTANGENPDADTASLPGHPTGERQARENRENDPPA